MKKPNKNINKIDKRKMSFYKFHVFGYDNVFNKYPEDTYGKTYQKIYDITNNILDKIVEKIASRY